MALCGRVIALAAILRYSIAMIEFSGSKLYDEKDFSVQVVSIPNYCDKGCSIYVSMPDSSADIAKQIVVHDYIHNDKSLYDISKMKMTDQKGYFEVEAIPNQNLNIINTNTKYASAPMAVWVVRNDADNFRASKVYDANNLTTDPLQFNIVTVMSAEPFTLQSQTTGPMGLIATLSGFDAITNDADDCTWVLDQLDPTVTCDIQTRVHSPLLTIFFDDIDHPLSETTITADVGDGKLDFSGISFAASPGYIGCNGAKGDKMYRSSLYDATTSYDYLKFNRLYDVSLTSVINTDTAHPVTIKDVTNDKEYEWSVAGGPDDSNNVTLERTNNLDISWTRNDKNTQQSFLIRLIPFNELIDTTMAPTTEATTEPVETTSTEPDQTSTEAPIETTTVTSTTLSPTDSTTTTPEPEKTTTEVIPDITSTITVMVPDSTSSEPIPEVTTTEPVPSSTTSTEPVPIPTTTSEPVPDQTTTEPAPDRTTTVFVPDPTTTEPVPITTTESSPDQTTTITEPFPDPTTTESSEDRTTTVVPDPTTTEQVVDRTTTAVLPDPTTTEPVPDRTTSVLLPDPTTTEQTPERTTTVLVPDPTTTEPAVTTAIVMPTPTTTEPIVDFTTTVMLPNPSTTEEVIERTTTVVNEPTTTKPVATTTVLIPDPTTTEPVVARTTTVMVPDPTTTEPVPIRTTTVLSPDRTSTDPSMTQTTPDPDPAPTSTDPVHHSSNDYPTLPTVKPQTGATTKKTTSATTHTTGHPKDISTTTLRTLQLPTTPSPKPTTSGASDYGSTLVAVLLASMLFL